MRILFDHNTPLPLRRYLLEHVVDTANERGWSELINGDLLDNAEDEGYEILITADQSMSYQAEHHAQADCCCSAAIQQVA